MVSAPIPNVDLICNFLNDGIDSAATVRQHTVIFHLLSRNLYNIDIYKFIGELVETVLFITTLCLHRRLVTISVEIFLPHTSYITYLSELQSTCPRAENPHLLRANLESNSMTLLVQAKASKKLTIPIPSLNSRYLMPTYQPTASPNKAAYPRISSRIRRDTSWTMHEKRCLQRPSDSISDSWRHIVENWGNIK